MSCLADAPAIGAEWCNRRQFFFAKSLVVSEFCCTFAASFESDKELRCRCTFPSKDLLLVDESPENAPFRSLLAFNHHEKRRRFPSLFLGCCCWLARLSSLTSKASWTKRVLRLDGGSVFFDSVLSGQDVGESTRGAARWAAPLH